MRAAREDMTSSGQAGDLGGGMGSEEICTEYMGSSEEEEEVVGGGGRRLTWYAQCNETTKG